MRYLTTKIILGFGILILCGCGHVTNAGKNVAEVGKTVWGSSTRALEHARAEAVAKVFPCAVEACMNGVLDLTVDDLSVDPPKHGALDLFMVNRRTRTIVVMGVPGSIDTTEVGIFFVEEEAGKVRVELSSLSSNAKKLASEIVFDKLGRDFKTKPTSERMNE